jgi:hypothetical protein
MATTVTSLLAQNPSLEGKSLFDLFIDRLGPLYGMGILFSGIGVFVGAWLVVSLSRRPAVIASYLLFVPIPLIIGAFWFLAQLWDFSAMWSLFNTPPKSSDIFATLEYSLYGPIYGLLFTLPAYFVTSIGLFVKIVRNKQARIENAEN